MRKREGIGRRVFWIALAILGTVMLLGALPVNGPGHDWLSKHSSYQ